MRLLVAHFSANKLPVFTNEISNNLTYLTHEHQLRVSWADS